MFSIMAGFEVFITHILGTSLVRNILRFCIFVFFIFFLSSFFDMQRIA